MTGRRSNGVLESGVLFEAMHALAYKLENGLIKLVERLEEKQQDGSWIDHLMVKESNEVYQADQHSNTPVLQYSKEPS